MDSDPWAQIVIFDLKTKLLRADIGTIIAEDEEERVQDLRKMIDELRVRNLVHGLDPA